MERKISRGDMFYADLAHGLGSEQYGRRPCVVVSNDAGNRHSNTVIVAMITSKVETKAKIPTHCPVRAQQGLVRDSLVLLEQLRTIDKMRLLEYLGTLDSGDMDRVEEALAASVGLS